MIPRIMVRFGAFFLVALLAGCTREEPVETLEPLQIAFEETIADSSIVATVSHEAGIDTFSTQEFRANLERLQMLFPEVMEDDERSSPIRREMVRQYVLEKLILAEARRRGVAADSTTVQTELGRFRSRFDSDESYQAELAEMHQTEDDLRSQFATSVSRDALIRSIQESLPGPTDAEVASFQDEMSVRLRVQHILVGVGEDPSDDILESAREEAERLIDSLDAGRPFAMLARRHSDDPGSKVSGGELPWFRKGEMVPEFERAAFKLEDQGEFTTRPVRTPYGYHIIRLLERQTDSVIQPDSARVMLVRRRVREANEELQRDLVGRAVVRTNPSFIPPDAHRAPGS